MKNIYWTRSISDFPTDQNLFDHPVTHVPCLRLEPIEAKLPDSVDIAIVTSQNTTKYGTPALQSKLRSAKKVYTHGPQTAAKLVQWGIKATLLVKRDAESFAEELVPILKAKKNIAYVSAEDPAFDMVSYFNSQGIQVTHVPIYRSHPELTGLDGKPLAKKDAKALCESMDGVICFASPKAVEGFLEGTKAYADTYKEKVAAAAIGPTTLKALEGHFTNTSMPERNSLAALYEHSVKLLG
jgi:uroporphyrinogen-III synthase